MSNRKASRLSSRQPYPFSYRDGRATGRGAFTLIELLTVIAIIGILAAILIPVLGSVRDSARASKCIGNLRSLGTAINLLIDDHDGVIRIWRRGSNSEGHMWANILDNSGYLGSREILYCPSRHPYAWDEPGSWPWNWRTYGFNMIPGDAGVESGDNIFRLNANAIRDPSRHFIFADSFKIAASGPSVNDGQSQRFRIPSWAPGPNFGGVHIRHGGRANLVFLDGHVSALSPVELGELGFLTMVSEQDRHTRVPVR